MKDFLKAIYHACLTFLKHIVLKISNGLFLDNFTPDIWVNAQAYKNEEWRVWPFLISIENKHDQL